MLFWLYGNEKYNIPFRVSEAHTKGGNGALSLAEAIIEICNKEIDYKQLYSYDLSIKEKIASISKNIYHAGNIIYSDKAENEINTNISIKLNPIFENNNSRWW